MTFNRRPSVHRNTEIVLKLHSPDHTLNERAHVTEDGALFIVQNYRAYPVATANVRATGVRLHVVRRRRLNSCSRNVWRGYARSNRLDNLELKCYG
jgi:hypothetical protein